MRMLRAALILLILPCAWAQVNNVRPETTLLAEVREKMLQLLVSQPNYTCLETVERTRQIPGGSAKVDDTLRLEVALVEGKEMFAWPGAKQFEDQEIREVVSTGMFGNGSYGIYARMLFSGSGPDFEYRGQVQLAGIEMARYDFRVHVSRSGYHLAVGEREAVSGFHGSIYLDPAKVDLRRLEIIADDIPPELGLTSSEDRVDYARVLIGNEEFLLPVESALQMATKDSLSRNRTRFSGCRKFAGESTLIFEDVELTEAGQAPVITEVTLPADVSLPLEISSDLNLDRGAVGDTVTAVLKSDVKRGKDTLIKKGAVAKGRVIMLQRTLTSFTLGISFQELEWKGGHAALKVKFEKAGGIAFAGRPRMYEGPGGTIQIFSTTRSMRGELLTFRTVP